jgi:hypothetical protein
MRANLAERRAKGKKAAFVMRASPEMSSGKRLSALQAGAARGARRARRLQTALCSESRGRRSHKIDSAVLGLLPQETAVI